MYNIHGIYNLCLPLGISFSVYHHIQTSFGTKCYFKTEISRDVKKKN